MPIEKPDLEAVKALSDADRLGVSAGDATTYQAAMEGLLGSWDAVERMYQETVPAQPRRTWSAPAPEGNPLGAWAVRTDIRGAASGPLAGLDVAIKDNTAVAGVPMRNGSWTVEGYVPREDASVVTRLLESGASIAGKSTCEDLCFSGGSHTSKPGPVRNPWDRSRSAGGSSSGTAALVASGEVDFGTGTDTGGSVRVPAAFSGVVGHKPTFGLVSGTGVFPIENSLDHVGPLARTVSMAARALTVMAGRDGTDPRQPVGMPAVDYAAALEQSHAGLRIGVVAEGFGHDNSDPEVDRAVRGAVEALTEAGLVSGDISIPWHRKAPAIWDVLSVEGGTWQMIDGNAPGLNWKGKYDPELMAYYGSTWRADPSRYPETVKLVAMAGHHALGTEYGRHYAMARALETHLTSAYDAALDRFDVLVMPTLPIRATALPGSDAPVDEVLGRALEMLTNTAAFNVTGHPACSVPAGVVAGLPVGMMIIGRHFDDATVLRVAHALETAVGGFPLPAERAAVV